MASFQYLSFADDIHRGNIDCDTDTFYVMLVDAAYTANQTTHTKRSDVTNEVTGTGYTAGGQAVTATVTKDTVNKRIDMVFAAVTWPSSTITARYAVYYKRRGGLASADELVCIDDFGANVISSGATFSLAATTSRDTVT